MLHILRYRQLWCYLMKIWPCCSGSWVCVDIVMNIIPRWYLRTTFKPFQIYRSPFVLFEQHCPVLEFRTGKGIHLSYQQRNQWLFIRKTSLTDGPHVPQIQVVWVSLSCPDVIVFQYYMQLNHGVGELSIHVYWAYDAMRPNTFLASLGCVLVVFCFNLQRTTYASQSQVDKEADQRWKLPCQFTPLIKCLHVSSSIK